MDSKEKDYKNFDIIIIEDDEGLNNLIFKTLRRHNYKCYQAFCGVQAMDLIGRSENPILLIDYQLPDITGKIIVEKIKKKYVSTPPFIVMTGFGDEKIAVEMMKMGAKDYIIKESGFLDILPEKLKIISKELRKQFELTQTKKQLNTSQQNFQELFETMTEGVVYQNAEGKIISANPAAEKILGLTVDPITGAISQDPGCNPVDEYYNNLSLENQPAMVALKTGQTVENFLQGIFNPLKNDYVWILVNSVPQFKKGEKKPYQVYSTFMDITERKKAMKLLQKSEEKFRGIFENSALGIFRSTPEGRYEDVNKAFAKILGFDSPQKMINEVTDISTLYKHPNDREKICQEFEKKGFVENYEIVANHPYKNKVWILVNARQRQDQDGHLFYEGTVQDITEKKMAEEKLKESKEEINRILSSSMDGILLTAPDGSVYSANPAACKMFGRSEKEICELGRDGVVDTSDPRLYEFIKKRNEKGKAKTEINLLHKTGNTFPAEVSSALFKDKDGNLRSSMIIRDITERKVAEEEKRKSKQRLELRKNIAEAFVMEDKNQIFCQTLKALLSFFGSRYGYIGHIDEKGGLICTTTYDSWNQCELGDQNNQFPQSVLDNLWLRSQNVKTNFILSNNLKFPVGYIPFKNAMVGVITFQDKPLGQIAFADKQKGYTQEDLDALEEICRYISPLLNALLKEELHKKELIEAKEKAEESDRLKSAFLANMSHEIRTPMNGILGFTDLLRESDITGEEFNEYLDIIRKSCNRLLDTVNDLIDISRIETGQVELKITHVNLEQELNNLYLFFKNEAQKKGLEFKMKPNCQTAGITVKSDPTKLNSVISNLVKNAIKYTSSGSIELGCIRYNGSIDIYVKDTGIGIPQQLQKNIFDRFVQVEKGFSRNYEGSGLGLSISKAYAEMLGGDLRLESEKGKGSTFYFTIPVDIQSIDSTLSPQHHENHPYLFPPNLKILIAEDDETSSRYLTHILKNHTGEILYAKTGDEAINLLINHSNIELVLMDIKMPVMDGYEATRKIREFNKEVPIIAQTALALAGDKEMILTAGFDDYITKPMSKKELLLKIDNAYRLRYA